MTTYSGFTTSNAVQVTGEEAVKEHFEKFVPSTNLVPQVVNERMQVVAYEGTAFIGEAALDEFWTGLAEIIEEVLIVRSVGFSDHRNLPDAEQWIVFPDGHWGHETLPDRHREDVPFQRETPERTEEEIAEEHGQIIEFGRLVKRLRKAVDHLETNGQTTTGVFDALDDADDLLNTVAAEEHAKGKAKQREVERLVHEEGLSLEEAVEQVD